MLSEKTIREEKIYEGKIFNIFKDRVSLPSGKETIREYIDHAEAVAMVPLTRQNEIIMVRQFRYAIKRELLEIPAGKMERGEEKEKSARRELSEEIKMDAGQLTLLSSMIPSPGCLNEIIHVFLAEDLFERPLAEDEDEFLEIVKIPFDQALDMVLQGKIEDAKSIVGILKTKELKGL
jgi:ADP-ribose pyrophosphatase